MAAVQLPFVASAASTPLYGDVNQNGSVEITDATDVQKYLAKMVDLTEEQLALADVDNDKSITVVDATTIQKYLAKLIEDFPINERINDSLNIDYSAFESREHTEEEQLYLELFDPNSVVNVEINISDAELQKIQDDYVKYEKMKSKSPIYRKADSVTFTVNGKQYTLEEVGVRMKGNMTRTSFFANNEMTDLIHFKLDFGETFDDKTYYGADAKVWTDKKERKARKNRTFATLEKIDLKWNATYDSTYMRQAYAYDMFRDYGMLATRSTAAPLTVGKTYCGIYSLNEPIDSVFLEKYLPAEEQGGDLYKCGWTDNGATLTSDCSIGIENEDNCEFYNYDLKTNKKISQHEAMKNLIRVLNSSTLNNETFESAVDKDYFVKFAALSYFSGNCDDMRNCYNNYYIYFRPNGKAVFIPYDFDRCLGITYGADPSGNGMTEVSPFSKSALLQNQSQRNPLYKYAITSKAAYKTEYTKALDEISQSKWMKYETYKPYYQAVVDHYSSVAIPQKSFDNVKSMDSLAVSEKTKNMSVSEFMSRITAYYASFSGK